MSLAIAIFSIASISPSTAQGGGGNNQDKVTICHIPPGNPDNPQTISVAPQAVPAHLAHGDSLGPCVGFLTIDPVQSPTAELAITLTGTSVMPTSVIRVQGGSEVVETISGEDRRFSVLVELIPNRLNRFLLSEIAASEVFPTVSVDVVQDLVPPALFIDFPQDGQNFIVPAINVSGRVSDMLSGFMGLGVEINGIPAAVDIGIGTNGSFFLKDLPLSMTDPTQITAIARDILGNESSRSITVQVVQQSEAIMSIVSGNNQAGVVHSLLVDPIVVRVTRPTGEPFPDKVVTFKVIRSDGRLSVDGSAAGAIMLQRMTDANGFAQAFWTLGADAGCGNQQVSVTSRDISGSIPFFASSQPRPPTRILIGSGNNQVGEAGGPALRKLEVWVTDGCNGVPAIAVTFTVFQGAGHVTEGMVMTGPTGHASTTFVFGSQPGNNVVSANFEGNPELPATFNIVGRVADQSTTRFSGQVLDNSLLGTGGATCRLELASGLVISASTNVEGAFVFPDLPEFGRALLHIDPTTATTIGGVPINPSVVILPGLAFEVALIKNAANSLPRPIYLPRLDPSQAVSYDGSQDAELTVEGIVGLRMIVQAGTTVTLPDGSIAGPGNPVRLLLSQVHHDEVPMPMPDGVASPFAWTLQPAETTFDPPVQIIYPNMTGLPAGSVTYFLSFNHDTGEFEIVASGRITDDGLCSVTDPGAGISVSGWGCQCPPYPPIGDCNSCPLRAEALRGHEFRRDKQGRVAEDKAPSGETFLYVYDTAGNLVREEKLQDGTRTLLYARTFDNLGRLLTQRDQYGQFLELAYDDAGTRFVRRSQEQ